MLPNNIQQHQQQQRPGIGGSASSSDGGRHSTFSSLSVFNFDSTPSASQSQFGTTNSSSTATTTCIPQPSFQQQLAPPQIHTSPPMAFNISQQQQWAQQSPHPQPADLTYMHPTPTRPTMPSKKLPDRINHLPNYYLGMANLQRPPQPTTIGLGQQQLQHLDMTAMVQQQQQQQLLNANGLPGENEYSGQHQQPHLGIVASAHAQAQHQSISCLSAGGQDEHKRRQEAMRNIEAAAQRATLEISRKMIAEMAAKGQGNEIQMPTTSSNGIGPASSCREQQQQIQHLVPECSSAAGSSHSTASAAEPGSRQQTSREMHSTPMAHKSSSSSRSTNTYHQQQWQQRWQQRQQSQNVAMTATTSLVQPFSASATAAVLPDQQQGQQNAPIAKMAQMCNGIYADQQNRISEKNPRGDQNRRSDQNQRSDQSQRSDQQNRRSDQNLRSDQNQRSDHNQRSVGLYDLRVRELTKLYAAWAIENPGEKGGLKILWAKVASLYGNNIPAGITKSKLEQRCYYWKHKFRKEMQQQQQKRSANVQQRGQMPAEMQTPTSAMRTNDGAGPSSHHPFIGASTSHQQPLDQQPEEVAVDDRDVIVLSDDSEAEEEEEKSGNNISNEYFEELSRALQQIGHPMEEEARGNWREMPVQQEVPARVEMPAMPELQQEQQEPHRLQMEMPMPALLISQRNEEEEARVEMPQLFSMQQEESTEMEMPTMTTMQNYQQKTGEQAMANSAIASGSFLQEFAAKMLPSQQQSQPDFSSADDCFSNAATSSSGLLNAERMDAEEFVDEKSGDDGFRICGVNRLEDLTHALEVIDQGRVELWNTESGGTIWDVPMPNNDGNGREEKELEAEMPSGNSPLRIMPNLQTLVDEHANEEEAGHSSEENECIAVAHVADKQQQEQQPEAETTAQQNAAGKERAAAPNEAANSSSNSSKHIDGGADEKNADESLVDHRRSNILLLVHEEDVPQQEDVVLTFVEETNTTRPAAEPPAHSEEIEMNENDQLRSGYADNGPLADRNHLQMMEEMGTNSTKDVEAAENSLEGNGKQTVEETEADTMENGRQMSLKMEEETFAADEEAEPENKRKRMKEEEKDDGDDGGNGGNGSEEERRNLEERRNDEENVTGNGSAAEHVVDHPLPKFRIPILPKIRVFVTDIRQAYINYNNDRREVAVKKDKFDTWQPYGPYGCGMPYSRLLMKRRNLHASQSGSTSTPIVVEDGLEESPCLTEKQQPQKRELRSNPAPNDNNNNNNECQQAVPRSVARMLLDELPKCEECEREFCKVTYQLHMLVHHGTVMDVNRLVLDHLRGLNATEFAQLVWKCKHCHFDCQHVEQYAQHCELDEHRHAVGKQSNAKKKYTHKDVLEILREIKSKSSGEKKCQEEEKQQEHGR